MAGPEHPSPGRGWRQQDAAAFPQLLEAITEFLQFHGLAKAAAALHEERVGSPDIKRPLAGKEGADRIKADLLRYFDQGRDDFFFAAFHQYVAASEDEAQKMEFRLNIYFAIFPVLPASSVLVARGGLGGTMPSARQELTTRMQALKGYLETKGAGLAHSGEFLHYYALPHVSHPERHPTFEHLFREDWAAGLRADLKRYIDTIPVISKVPRLYTWYSAADGEASPPLSRQGSMQRQDRMSLDSLASFAPSNGRTPRASDMAADRAPSITPTPRGGALPPIRGSHSELAKSQARASDPGITLPPLRPPPSKSRIPAPPVPQPGVVPSYPKPRNPRVHHQLSPSPRASDQGGRWTVDEEPSGVSVHSPAKGAAALRASQRGGMLAPLDYQEILYVVVKGSKEGGSAAALAARLLQALRWRLVRSNAGNDRWEVLATWIQVDLMGVYSYDGQATQELLKAAIEGPLPMATEAARLANSIASDRLGRAYLMQSAKTVSTLLTLLKRGAGGGAAMPISSSQDGGHRQGAAPSAEEDALVQQCLMTLHKLSLKRQGQTQMLKQGLLQWLVTFLQNEALSEVTVESGFALLMNLCLRSAGKAASQQVAGPLMQLCQRYLESPNPQIRTYVHGILYSTAQRPAVRREAQQQGLPTKLKTLQLTAQEPFISQIRYILKQLDGPPRHSRMLDESEDASGEDASDAYYDDEDAFAELKKAPETLHVQPGELQGEPLLCSAYLAGAREAREQAQLLQSMTLDAPPAKASSLAVSMRSTRRARDSGDSEPRRTSGMAAAAAAAVAASGAAMSWDDVPVGGPSDARPISVMSGGSGLGVDERPAQATVSRSVAEVTGSLAAAGSQRHDTVDLTAGSAMFGAPRQSEPPQASYDETGSSALFGAPRQPIQASYEETAGSAMFGVPRQAQAAVHDEAMVQESAESSMFGARLPAAAAAAAVEPESLAETAMFKEELSLDMTADSAIFNNNDMSIELTAGSAMFKHEPSQPDVTRGSTEFDQPPAVLAAPRPEESLQLTAGSAVFRHEPSGLDITAGSAMFGLEPSHADVAAGSATFDEPPEATHAASEPEEQAPLAMTAGSAVLQQLPSGLNMTAGSAVLQQLPSGLNMTAGSAVLQQLPSGLNMTAGSAVLQQLPSGLNMTAGSAMFAEPQPDLESQPQQEREQEEQEQEQEQNLGALDEYQPDSGQPAAFSETAMLRAQADLEARLMQGSESGSDDYQQELRASTAGSQHEADQEEQQPEAAEAEQEGGQVEPPQLGITDWPFANQGELQESDLLTETQRQMLQAEAELQARLLNGSPSVTEIDPQSVRGSTAGSVLQQPALEADGENSLPALGLSHQPSGLPEAHAADEEFDAPVLGVDMGEEMQQDEEDEELHAAGLAFEAGVAAAEREQQAEADEEQQYDDEPEQQQEQQQEDQQQEQEEQQEEQGLQQQEQEQEQQQADEMLQEGHPEAPQASAGSYLVTMHSEHQGPASGDAVAQGLDEDNGFEAGPAGFEEVDNLQLLDVPHNDLDSLQVPQGQSRPASQLSAAPRPASGMSQGLSRPESFQAGGALDGEYGAPVEHQGQSRPGSSLSAVPRPASGTSQHLSRPGSFQAVVAPDDGFGTPARQQSRPGSTLSPTPRPPSGTSQQYSRPASVQATALPDDGYGAPAEQQGHSRPASTLSAAASPLSGASQHLSRPDSFQADGMQDEGYGAPVQYQVPSRPASTLSAAPRPASGASQRLSRPESFQAGGLPDERFEVPEAAEQQGHSRPESRLSAGPRPASSASQAFSRPASIRAGAMPDDGFGELAEQPGQSRPASTLSAAPRLASGASQHLGRPDSFQEGVAPGGGYGAPVEQQEQSRPASTFSAAPRPASGMSQRLSRPASGQAGGMPDEGYVGHPAGQGQSRPVSTLSAAARPASGMSQHLSRPESFQAGGAPYEEYGAPAEQQGQSRPVSTMSAAPRPASGMSQRTSRPVTPHGDDDA